MRGSIVLCGFMGCGKTSVGKRLSEKLNREFVDLDGFIEDKFGLTISEIFKKYGEARFREIENAAVREVASGENTVIACGGGTVLRKENVRAFKDLQAAIIYIEVPVDVLQKRLESDVSRPLLQRDDRREFIERLYGERRRFYDEAADYTVDGGAPVDEVAEKIIGLICQQRLL